MIDIHSHLIPGVDDGAGSFYEAVEMARIAVSSGVNTLVVTPHSNQMGRFENFDSFRLRSRFEELRLALDEEGIPVRLLRGMEIFCVGDVAGKIDAGLLCSLNGSRYYLVEFPFDYESEDMDDGLDDLLERGYIPLIAHPERYACVQERPAAVYEWVQRGCLTQLNKGSLLGRFGRHAKETARVLLENDLITCVASDAHSARIRTSLMQDTN